LMRRDGGFHATRIEGWNVVVRVTSAESIGSGDVIARHLGAECALPGCKPVRVQPLIDTGHRNFPFISNRLSSVDLLGDTCAVPAPLAGVQ
jgi:hypothetical protein